MWLSNSFVMRLDQVTLYSSGMINGHIQGPMSSSSKERACSSFYKCSCQAFQSLFKWLMALVKMCWCNYYVYFTSNPRLYVSLLMIHFSRPLNQASKSHTHRKLFSLCTLVSLTQTSLVLGAYTMSLFYLLASYSQHVST